MPHPPSDGTTSDLIRAAQAGQIEALGPVCAALEPLLLAQARLRLGPRLTARGLAEDLVHDAWEVAIRRLGDFEEHDGRLTPVLVRFLSTTILNMANGILRRTAREVAAGSGIENAAAAAILRGEARGPKGVSTAAGDEEVRRHVAAVLETLSPEDRRVLVGRTLEDSPWALVAADLGCTPEAARKRHRRLVAALRPLLAGTAFDDLGAE